jgi:mannose/fructose/N-acetylgalactosamine-specific phosphotransferase system component IIB
MTLAQVRVDERLVHGQVVLGWIPALGVRRLLVLDDEAARDPRLRGSMALAVPDEVHVAFRPLPEAAAAIAELARDPAPGMVVLRSIDDACRAFGLGARFPRLTLGNVHAAPGRAALSAAIHLDAGDLDDLESLGAAGIQVEARTLPADAPIPFDRLRRLSPPAAPA